MRSETAGPGRGRGRGGPLNSLESDLWRAVVSVRFLLAAAVPAAALFYGGAGSTLFRMTVPLACTFPYACGFPDEYRDGFTKLALARTTVRGYILGKFTAACVSGGAAEVLAAFLYDSVSEGEGPCCTYGLLFLSAMLWAGTAALLAAVSGNKCLAYGGPFVLYYFLVILAERYWKASYCLYPYEWITPEHTWMFGDTGIVLLLSGILLVLALAFYSVVERRLENV